MCPSVVSSHSPKECPNTLSLSVLSSLQVAHLYFLYPSDVQVAGTCSVKDMSCTAIVTVLFSRSRLQQRIRELSFSSMFNFRALEGISLNSD